MTTKELIAALLAADPGGDLPVCVGTDDIYFAEVLPGYYDGVPCQLVHDESKRGKAWSIAGVKYVRSSDKVRLCTMSTEDVLFDAPETPVEGGDPVRIEEWRAAGREARSPPGQNRP